MLGHNAKAAARDGAVPRRWNDNNIYYFQHINIRIVNPGSSPVA